MIERFYLQNYLSFSKSELNFTNGLVVFTGPSGSGKSILMESILSSVGLRSCDATVCESSVTWQIDEQKYGISNEDSNVFKQMKKEKARYFINNQSLSRKAMGELTSHYLRHLSLKDYSDFSNEKLLELIDKKIALHTPQIEIILQKYQTHYQQLQKAQKELQTIEDEEKRVVELKEFAAFEIQKIATINPQKGEDEELLKIKRSSHAKRRYFKVLQVQVRFLHWSILLVMLWRV
jgi:DNA repair protein RecN (Recombination protein N)